MNEKNKKELIYEILTECLVHRVHTIFFGRLIEAICTQNGRIYYSRMSILEQMPKALSASQKHLKLKNVQVLLELV